MTTIDDIAAAGEKPARDAAALAAAPGCATADAIGDTPAPIGEPEDDDGYTEDDNDDEDDDDEDDEDPLQLRRS